MTKRYHHGNLPTALRCAAADVITEQGLGSFSLREVARRAGVSHTAPAHHFGDVTGLLTSLACEGFEKLYEAMSAAAAEHSEPAERLVAIGQAYVATGALYPAHCEVMFRADVVHQDDPQLQHVGVRAYGVLHETVAAVCTAEHLDFDVDDAAKLCWAAMQGLLVLHASMVRLDEMGGQEPVSRDTLVVSFAQLLTDGLRAHPAGRAKRRPRRPGTSTTPAVEPSVEAYAGGMPSQAARISSADRRCC